MARPRLLRSVEWRSPEGERLPKLEPVLTPLWRGNDIETSDEYADRVKAFFERRESVFTHVANATRMRQARSDRAPDQVEIDRAGDRERKQAARDNFTDEQKASEKTRLAALVRKPRRFVGIDGEGCGEDALGRQNYVLMVASDTQEGDEKFERILKRDGDALLTRDCFDFILSMPAKAILVGFFFSYDVNQMLRGMIAQQNTVRSILKPYHGKNGPCPTYWGDYAITISKDSISGLRSASPTSWMERGCGK